jgi:hypothetical protein
MGLIAHGLSRPELPPPSGFSHYWIMSNLCMEHLIETTFNLKIAPERSAATFETVPIIRSGVPPLDSKTSAHSTTLQPLTTT